MAYDEKLAARVAEILLTKTAKIEEKKMFGGLCFMVNDKMCVGVESNRLMVRLDPKHYEIVMKEKGCEPMNFTGKIMKGYVFVATDVLKNNKQLQYWIDLAIEFNSIAKASKKKK